MYSCPFDAFQVFEVHLTEKTDCRWMFPVIPRVSGYSQRPPHNSSTQNHRFMSVHSYHRAQIRALNHHYPSYITFGPGVYISHSKLCGNNTKTTCKETNNTKLRKKSFVICYTERCIHVILEKTAMMFGCYKLDESVNLTEGSFLTLEVVG